MKEPWYRKHPELFERIKGEVQNKYPNLHFYEEPESLFARGSFPLEHEGRTLDRFSVEIELPRKDVDDLPVLREIGGRIPHTPDNHVNAGIPKGDICLFVPDERYRVFPKGSSLLDFLDGPVRNFFLGFALKENGQPWPFGERKHGREGIVEFYSELLGTSDTTVIKSYLHCLSAKVAKGHWWCPCGSGEKIRKCHCDFIRELRGKIEPATARKSLKYFINNPKFRLA